MLGTEGDHNQSPARKDWHDQIQDDTTYELLDQDSRYFLHQALSTPCLNGLKGAQGIYLEDLRGRRYMDFHGNNVHQLGYGNPEILEAVRKQLDILPFSPRRYTNVPAVEFAKELTSLLPDDLNRVLFAPGGTSAISMALKLARLVTGKYKMVSVWDSFHGASLDAIGVGGEREFRDYMGPIALGNERIPPPVSYRPPMPGWPENDLLAAEYLHYVAEKEGDIAAFIIETVRNTDVQIPSAAYWKRVREICDQFGILLILDEIPIAFGRTGKMFAFENFPIVPDILCLGKGMGGGIFPLAGIVARDSFNLGQKISLGHFTHEKNPVAAAAGLAMLNYIKNHRILEKVENDSRFLHDAFANLKSRHEIIGDVRGIGLLWGIELVSDRITKTRARTEAEKVMYTCMQNGLSFKVSQGNVLQLSPPLTITSRQLAEAVEILSDAIHHLG